MSKTIGSLLGRKGVGFLNQKPWTWAHRLNHFNSCLSPSPYFTVSLLWACALSPLHILHVFLRPHLFPPLLYQWCPWLPKSLSLTCVLSLPSDLFPIRLFHKKFPLGFQKNLPKPKSSSSSFRSASLYMFLLLISSHWVSKAGTC